MEYLSLEKNKKSGIFGGFRPKNVPACPPDQKFPVKLYKNTTLPSKIPEYHNYTFLDYLFLGNLSKDNYVYLSFYGGISSKTAKIFDVSV